MNFQNEKKIFKIMAWTLTEEDTLEPYSNLDAINKGLIEYYSSV